MSRFFWSVRPYLVALPVRINEPERRLRLVVDEAGVEKVHGAQEMPCAQEVPGAQEVPSSARVRKPSPSYLDRDDQELVALYRAGQPAAFEALYRRYSRYAMALGVRVQGSPTDIEDIVHDAFLRVHDRLDTLRAGASFRPWLASVVVSLVRTRLRKRRMLSMLGLTSADPIDLDSLVNSEAGPEVRAQIAQVYAVLRELPVDHSICWTLRYVEGRKLEEVAEVAACSLATAKRRIAQVQQRMLLLDSQGAHEGTSSWFQAGSQMPANAPFRADADERSEQ